MRFLKLFLLSLLHLVCTLLVQFLLFQLLQKNESSFWVRFLSLLPGILVCFADLIISCLLLKRSHIGRTPFILLQFWDILLICPLLVIAFFGLFSEGGGFFFSVAAMVLDLLLIIERSTSFVLFDPQRSRPDGSC